MLLRMLGCALASSVACAMVRVALGAVEGRYLGVRSL
jgi:hypothetical protein